MSTALRDLKRLLRNRRMASNASTMSLSFFSSAKTGVPAFAKRRRLMSSSCRRLGSTFVKRHSDQEVLHSAEWAETRIRAQRAFGNRYLRTTSSRGSLVNEMTSKGASSLHIRDGNVASAIKR